MLYTPWRNETTDLMKECQNYQERFEQVKDKVISNRLQYEYHSEILDKVMEDINNAEYDDFDTVAPNAEHIISRIVLSRRSVVNYLVALILGKTRSIISMI